MYSVEQEVSCNPIANMPDKNGSRYLNYFTVQNFIAKLDHLASE